MQFTSALFLLFFSLSAFAAGENPWWFNCTREENGVTQDFRLEKTAEGYTGTITVSGDRDAGKPTVETGLDCKISGDNSGTFFCKKVNPDGTKVVLKGILVEQSGPDEWNDGVKMSSLHVSYYPAFSAPVTLRFAPWPHQCLTITHKLLSQGKAPSF